MQLPWPPVGRCFGGQNESSRCANEILKGNHPDAPHFPTGDSGHKINRHCPFLLTAYNWANIDSGAAIHSSHRKTYDIRFVSRREGTLLAVYTLNGKTSGHFPLDGHKVPVWLSLDELLDAAMQVAYAVPVDKSQGNEYDLVPALRTAP